MNEIYEKKATLKFNVIKFVEIETPECINTLQSMGFVQLRPGCQSDNIVVSYRFWAARRYTKMSDLGYLKL